MVIRSQTGLRPSKFAGMSVVTVFCAILAGCSSSTLDGNGVGTASYAAPSEVLTVCSGYGCIIKDKLTFASEVPVELEKIMEPGRESAAAERTALKLAIAYMEREAQKSLRYQNDVEFSYQRHRGKRGQMDCVDESRNTVSYLKFLHSKGLLRHHKPISGFAERGVMFDGRYPHKSARMRDNTGVDWAVDSWKTANGGLPEVFLLSEWYRERNGAEHYRN